MATRGRKPKSCVPATVVDAPEKVKRGRKPKTVIGFESAHICSSDDEHIIMKLNVQNEVSSNEDLPGAYNELSSQNFSEIQTCSDNAPSDFVIDKQLKVVELLKDFEEKNKNNEWPQTTCIHCYWCCHKFETPPFGIPLKYVNNQFQVYGCFCSLECASAYNFDSKESKDEIWERYNLINLIARSIGYSHTVKAAPTRLALTIFGGYLDIDMFRNFCKTSKLININFPPMMTLTQQIEEINDTDLNSESKYIPVDTDRILKYKEKLTLKRSKPINTLENTLDHSMNLKYGI